MGPKDNEGPAGGTVPACRFTVPTDAEEAPVNDAVAGLPAALLATFSEAENVPAVVDAKVTVMEQLAPMASVDPHVLPVTVKSL